jgi:hypothetical protein
MTKGNRHNGGFLNLKSHLPVGLETFAQAKRRRSLAKKALRRGNKQHRRVAKVLRTCTKRHPCASETCSVCARQFRIDLLRAGSPILHSRPDWTAASVITAGLAIQYGNLDHVDAPKILAMIRTRLQRSPILKSRIVFGGLDISLNVQNNRIEHWQVHLYMLIEGADDRELRNAVGKAFLPEPGARRPYQFRPVIDFPEASSYVYKSIFYRRSRYKKDGIWQTRRQPLKQKELHELQAFLHRIPLGGRLLLHGLRRNGKPLRLQTTSPRKNPRNKRQTN